MLQAATVLSRLSLAAALAGVLPALGADQTIRAEAQRALATPYSTDDPEVAAYTLKFDLRLTNRLARPVALPDADMRDETTRIAVLGVQSKQPDGRWTYLVQSSWYDTGTIKYASCTSLPPEGTLEIGNVASGVLLLKKQLAGLGGEPNVRLNLMIFCRQPDGKVLTTSVTTAAFSLRLPAQP